MEAVNVGPWRGYDPRNDDWHCSYCRCPCPNGPRNCFSCHRPRLLTEEEKEHIRKSEHSGEMLCKKVMVGQHRRKGLNSMIEAFRQWCCIPAQAVTIDKKRYISVAVRSDKDEDKTNTFFGALWRELKEYTFSEQKPLNDITMDAIRKNENDSTCECKKP